MPCINRSTNPEQTREPYGNHEGPFSSSRRNGCSDKVTVSSLSKVPRLAGFLGAGEFAVNHMGSSLNWGPVLGPSSSTAPLHKGS